MPVKMVTLPMACVAALWLIVPAAAQEGSRNIATRTEASGIRAVPGPIPRTADGKPDLSGTWRPQGGGGRNILEEHLGGYGIVGGGPSLIVDPPDGKIPYRPWALEERNRRRDWDNTYEDNRGKCYLTGPIRLMLTTSTFVPVPGHFLRFGIERQETMSTRMGPGPHIPDAIRLWNGDSVAHWEGDTLVIENTNFDGKSWLGLAGDFHSRDARIVERISPINKDALIWEATITDPTVFTRPWTLKFPLPWARVAGGGSVPGLDLDEEDLCHELNLTLAASRKIYEQRHGPKSATFVHRQATETVRQAAGPR